MTAPAQSHSERLAHARAVLGLAEHKAQRHGGRIDRSAWQSVSVPHPAPSPRSSPISVVPGAGSDQEAARGSSTPGSTTSSALPVPEALSEILPAQGIRAGSTVAISGGACSSLLLAMAAAASSTGAWCAIAGMHDLGVRCAVEAGLDAERLAIVHAQPEQHAAVLSAVLDGVAVLVLGADLELSAGLWRALSDRARTNDTVVLAASPPGRADLHLHTRSWGWSGLGHGSGHLRQRPVEVSAHGRGIPGQRSATVLMPHPQALIAAATSSTAAPASPLRIRSAGATAPSLSMVLPPAAAPAPVRARAERSRRKAS